MDIYSYDDLCRQLCTIPSVHAVGHSAFGRTIWCIRVGSGVGGGLVHGAIHAREHITAPLVVALALVYARQYHTGMPPIDFVPMVNPDGVQLCAQGVYGAPFCRQKALLRYNGGCDFALWKANGRGVDLNTNFAADWGNGESNVFTPGSQNYVGPRPASEPETRTLVRLTDRRQYDYTLSYHCKGEVVYYGFGRGECSRHSEQQAHYFAKLLGYQAHTSPGSTGGYKDWYALHYPRGVALTIEVGRDDLPHPLPYGILPDLVKQHRWVPGHIARYIQEKLCTKPTCDKP